jgi:hypothetical protein
LIIIIIFFSKNDFVSIFSHSIVLVFSLSGPKCSSVAGTAANPPERLDRLPHSAVRFRGDCTPIDVDGVATVLLDQDVRAGGLGLDEEGQGHEGRQRHALIGSDIYYYFIIFILFLFLFFIYYFFLLSFYKSILVGCSDSVVLAIINRFNYVSEWVSTIVCMSERVKDRVKVIVKFIEVAIKLKQVSLPCHSLYLLS